MKACRGFVVVLLLFAAAALHAGNPANPILFVTQIPIPEEVNTRDITQSFMSTVSPFSNHLADTRHAGRGGSLFIRFSNAQVVDLLAIADWTAIPGGQPPADAMAVRNPAVDWTGTKAIFSMTTGKPTGPADNTQYLFQLYEITLPTQGDLAANVKPVLTKVANQPTYNNVFPTYAQGGKIVFASDRPYNGQPHLTQREEYLGLPSVSGLWLLDPANAASLKLLHHAPSGAFNPTVDSAGRVIFTNWDHMSRDSEAVTDFRNGDPNYQETFTQTANGSGNFADETAGAAFTPVTSMPNDTWDIFPEPRNFDRKTLATLYPNLNGNAFNLFMPWMITLNGTGGELLNHVGRHEVGSAFTKSFTNDSSIVDFNPATAPSATNGNYAIHNFFQDFFAPKEDPLNPGTFFGADGPDLGTHGAGRIVRLTGGGAGANADNMLVLYLTQNAGAPPVKGGMNIPPTGLSPSAFDLDLYRTPVPLADGNLVASHVAVRQTDYNTNTVGNPVPVSGYNFRLRSLKPPVMPAIYYTNDVTLTAGITINTSYWAGSTLVSYNGLAWELDPVEVAARTEPPAPGAAAIHPNTAAQFAAANVDIPTFQNWLTANNAALSVSFDVTKRDFHDTQQPFNLRVAWSGHQSTKPGTTGLYDIAWQRFYQADLRRGYTLGGGTPAPGRRIVATPLHDTIAHNVQTLGAPAGAVRIGDDGSVAAILPAGKALSWELLANDAPKTSQVKERFWVTFQKGEIRTCTNCHGINTKDQTSTLGAPTNAPAALGTLLAQWRAANPPGTMQFAAAMSSVAKTAANMLVVVTRTGGSTGPVSVQYGTSNGTALAGTDYTAASGTLSWNDGDTAPKTITVPLLGSPATGPVKTVLITLSAPAFGSLGLPSVHTLAITEPGAAAATLDVDLDAQYHAATDGLLVLRYLFGLSGNALTDDATGALGTRKLAMDIIPYLDGIRALLDVDANGSVDALTDGVMIVRYLFGLRGAALTGGALGASAKRTAGEIELYLQGLTP